MIHKKADLLGLVKYKKARIVNHKKLNRIPEKVFVVMHLSDW